MHLLSWMISRKESIQITPTSLLELLLMYLLLFCYYINCNVQQVSDTRYFLFKWRFKRCQTSCVFHRKWCLFTRAIEQGICFTFCWDKTTRLEYRTTFSESQCSWAHQQCTRTHSSPPLMKRTHVSSGSAPPHASPLPGLETGCFSGVKTRRFSPTQHRETPPFLSNISEILPNRCCHGK